MLTEAVPVAPHSMSAVLAALLVAAIAVPPVAGHGRLIQPPGRSTAWRYGFPTPPNYNDHEIYCGGFGRQWNKNGGKCGPCGDAWDAPQPRANEGGGKYGLGVITATYKEGAEVSLGIEITANHGGYFEFHLCPHNSPKRPVTQSCLEQNLLQRADGSGPYYRPAPGTGKLFIRYRLPKGITCKQCVLQWRYECASNWGVCANGTGMMGCGPQEEFRSCADITIVSNDGAVDDTPSVPDELPVSPTDEDYNEVDTDKHHQEDVSEEPNYPGHIIALTLACILLPLLLLAVILYFYFARDRIRAIINKHVKIGKMSGEDEANSVTASSSMETSSSAVKSEKDLDGSSRLDFPNPPFGIVPSAPPRRNRRRETSVSPSRDSNDSGDGSMPSYPV